MGERTAQRRLVVVDLPPGPRLVAALRDAWDGGPAVAPLPRGLPPRARDEVLATLRGSRLISERGSVPLPDPLPVADDVALVVATSGSTGVPGGIALSRRALEASAVASLARLGVPRAGAAGALRWLCCLPPSSMGGIGVVTRSFVAGTEPVVRRFSPGAVAEAVDADAVSLVPTMLVRLLDAGVDLARFRHVLLGGAAAPAALLARAREAGAAVVTTYGLTETCGGCVYDGVALDRVEVDVQGEGGRVRIRGAVLAEGYRDGGPVAGADGWLVTDDLGRLAEDGRLEVLGRADDVIVSGGVNVAAGGVAALLAEHPAVAEAAVLGAPDPEWGQRVVAVVVPRDPAAPPDLPTLRAFVAERSAPATAPRQLLLTDHLPLLPNGKLDRLALRQRAAHAGARHSRR